MIYLDHASTTLPKPRVVIEAVTEAMLHAGNADRGVTEASLGAANIIYQTREILARYFYADSPREIVFASNATEALNIAIKGLLNPGDHCITTMLEHNSVLRPLYELENRGLQLAFIPCDSLGNPKLDEIEALVKPNTKAIICTHGSNVTGNMVDIFKVGEIAKKYNLLFIVDGSQVAGFYRFPVHEAHVDVYCFTGHKGFYGPQGTGGMYVKAGTPIKPLKTGGTGFDSYRKTHPEHMPTRLEAGTLNAHGLAGLCRAIEYEWFSEKTVASEQADRHQYKQHLCDLTRYFYERVSQIPGVKVYGDFTKTMRLPVVSINLADIDSSTVGDDLFNEYGIATRAGAHCAPLMHEALGTTQQGAVRFSFSSFTTTKELDLAINAMVALTKKYI